MAPTFPGYPAKGITWLRNIAKHNERDWFLAHKATFEEAVKAPTQDLVRALNQRIVKFAPAYVADPAKALTRIYRDVRFRKDKSPYNTYVAARFLHRGGRRNQCAGFSFQVTAKGVDVIGGVYAPDGPLLRRIRARLASDSGAFRRVCSRKALRDAMGPLQGDRLKRTPRGFPPDHPAADLLRHKQLYFETHLPVAVARSPDLVKEISRRFRLMTPFVTWLQDA